MLFLPQSVVIPINYPTTNCNILLQNIVDYHKKYNFTANVTFYHNVRLHFTTECGNPWIALPRSIVFYFKIW